MFTEMPDAPFLRWTKGTKVHGTGRVLTLERVIRLGEDAHSPFNRPTGSGQSPLVHGKLHPAGVDRLSKPLDGEIRQFFSDRLEAAANVLKLPRHGVSVRRRARPPHQPRRLNPPPRLNLLR